MRDNVEVALTSEEEPLIDPERLLPILTKIGVTASPSQVHLLLTVSLGHSEFSDKDVRQIQEAADFFSPVSPMFAFLLHLALVFVYTSLGRSDKRFRSLLSCAFTAVSIADINLARNLLESEISKSLINPANELSKFLLGLTLTVLQSPSKISEPEEQKKSLRSALKIFYDPARLRRASSRSLGLTEYHIVDFVVRFVIHRRYFVKYQRYQLEDIDDSSESLLKNICQYATDPEARRLAQDLLEPNESNIPRPFGLIEEVLEGHFLRESLEWCVKALEGNTVFPREWLTLRQNAYDKSIVESTGIYSLLWLLWNQPYGHLKKKPFSRSQWKGMDLSSSEFIWELVLLMSRCSPRDRTFSRTTRSLVNPDQVLVHRTIDGAKSLLELSDAQLAKRFLDQFLNRNTKDTKQDVRFHRISSQHPGQQQQQSLYEFAVLIFGEGIKIHRRWTLSTPSFSDTLAASESSSTLSDMRRLAV